MADLPSAGTQEYLWWSQGAADEAKARNEGLSPAAIDLRATLEAMAQTPRPPALTAEGLLTALVRIYCPERLRRKYRS